eukprot:385543_1
MKQYINEYQKAGLHYTSYYRKVNYTNMEKSTYLLVLMIYCNYTEFQYKFSKTYRENNGKNHCNFYCFASYLMCTLSEHGTLVKDGTVTRFYHGISEELVFPYKNDTGIHVCCPLSTSSSFEVAANFTNDSNGMVVQFGLFDGNKYNQTRETCRYFSLSWVSDYANESEYLFLQTASDQGSLCIANILNTRNGFEYEYILQTLKTMDMILFDANHRQKINDISNTLLLTQRRKTLIFTIIINQHNLSSFHQQKFTTRSTCTLDEYSKKLCHEYFKEKKVVKLDLCPEMRKRCLNCEDIFNLFTNTNAEIVLDKISVLFRNMDILYIGDISLISISATLERIVSHLTEFNGSKIREIWLKPKGNYKISMNIIHKYFVKLRQKSLFMILVVPKMNLGIFNYGNEEFVQFLISRNDAVYFQDKGKEITNLMRKRIERELILNEQKIDSAQEMFHLFCKEQTVLRIYTNSLLFILMRHPNSDWIKIKEIVQLFPNLWDIYIFKPKVCSLMFEDILQCINAFPNRTIHISLWSLLVGKDWSIPLIISKYQQRFNAAGCQIAAFGNGNSINIRKKKTIKY